MTARQFHRLKVRKVEELTDDAVAISFEIPPHLRSTFDYLPGQHVTVRADIDGEDVRRSYSICANANVGDLRIGVKRLPGGAFSTWATSQLSAGVDLEVMPPVGEFTTTPEPIHYGAIAAGSGITPVLSLVSTFLESEPGCRFTVIFGNRGAESIMFLDELEGLKNRYPERLQIVHVLSREGGISDLFSGRITSERLADLLDRIVGPQLPREWFLCGPFDMVMDAQELLTARGVPRERVHDELFFAGPLDLNTLPAEPAAEEGTVQLELSLEGRSSSTRMRPETSILDAALRVRPELPYSCKGGMCASCKARLVDGEVAMEKNWALVESEVAAGFILTCQAHPQSDRVKVDFDV